MGVGRRKRGAGWRRSMGGLVLLVAAVVGVYVLRSRAPAPVPAPPAPPVPPVAGGPPSPTTLATLATQVPSEPPLPPLAESDPAVRDLARTISPRPDVEEWLSATGLVQRLVAVVDDVAEGVTPRPLLLPIAPSGPFVTVTRGDRVYVDPESYARYDEVAAAFASLDPDACAEVYRRLAPLIDEAYRDLGRPERRFADALARAIARLLATPVVDGEVELRPLVTTHAFADRDLEKLSAAQKQLLRMGPQNVRAIQAHLREIAGALGIPTIAG